MKIIDDKGKLFGKLNILDLMGICLILFLVFLSFLKITDNSISSITLSEIEVPAEMKLSIICDKGYFEVLKVGDKIAEDKRYLGDECKVTKIEFQDVYKTNVDANGKAVKSIDPTLQEAIVTVETTLVKKGPVYKLGKQEVRHGIMVFLESSSYKYSTKVVDLQVQ